MSRRATPWLSYPEQSRPRPEAAAGPQTSALALLRFVVRDRALLTASILLGILVFLAVFGPLIWRKDPLAVDLLAALEPPSREHPMGTDNLGRDVFARFNEGAQDLAARRPRGRRNRAQ